MLGDNRNNMKKGYFETICNGHFKTLSDGKRVFYEQGPIGRRGFEIATQDQEDVLRKAIKRYYIWIFGLCFFANLLVTTNPTYFIFTLLCVVFLAVLITRLYFRKYTKNMILVKTANSPFSHWKNMGKTLHPVHLYGGALLCLLFVLAGLLLYQAKGDFITLLCSIIFSLIMVPFLVGIWYRIYE